MAYLLSRIDRIMRASPDVIERGAKSAAQGDNPSQGKVRLNVDVSTDIASFLDALAQENAITKSEVMRRAIALLKVAHEEKRRHRSMGFVSMDRDQILETKVVGVL